MINPQQPVRVVDGQQLIGYQISQLEIAVPYLQEEIENIVRERDLPRVKLHGFLQLFHPLVGAHGAKRLLRCARQVQNVPDVVQGQRIRGKP
ncbi:hypothetical protein [Clavibacter michiganensis]|uniref:hypothetical protein n=1 Tax=Clavibacter michiganensis TaxID=28447 RepID=UPI002931C03D|nr:hypothetical protein [Clavibacter michiganensis]